MNSKWIIDMNLNTKTLKLSEASLLKKLDKDFFDILTPKAQSIKEKINKLHFLQNFCSSETLLRE